MRIREIPLSDRPREKLASRGPSSLTDAELLAIFLRTGIQGKSAIHVAADLLQARGSLHNLSRLTVAEIQKAAKGIGPAKACELAAAFELGKRLARGTDDRPILDRSDLIYATFAPELQARNREVLKILLLDTKLRLIVAEDIALGSLNECIAHPREIFRPAIAHSAAAVVVLHNHPSGDPAPSIADRRLTNQLRQAASLLQIELLDHIIIGTPSASRPSYFSFRDSSGL